MFISVFIVFSVRNPQRDVINTGGVSVSVNSVPDFSDGDSSFPTHHIKQLLIPEGQHIQKCVINVLLLNRV